MVGGDRPDRTVLGRGTPRRGPDRLRTDGASDPSLDVVGAVMTGSSLATEPVLAKGTGLPACTGSPCRPRSTHGDLVLTGWTMTPA